MYPTRTTLLETLLRSLFALAASGLLLLVAFAVYSERLDRGPTPPPEPIVLAGKDLQAVVGSAKVAGDALEFTGYESRDGEHVAVAVWRGRIRAEHYPLLRYQVDARFPGPVLKLVWRTAQDPGVLKSVDIAATDGDAAWLELSRHPDWRATVLELGIYAYTEDEHDALSIAQLALQPHDWRGELASTWADWTGFRGWTSRSINLLYGTADAAALSPVLAVGAWAVLAVILLLIMGVVAGRLFAGALAAAVLVPWIALDLLWQEELMTQLAQTRDQFGGKSVAQKHLADVDRHIYRYITRLKDEVLPAGSSRILLLHNSHSHNFNRLKAQYYLLPHNVFNFGRVPPEYGLGTIDYILVLGDSPRLEYDAGRQALLWKHGRRSLPVELLDDDFMGRLYRVLPRAGAKREGT